MLARSLIAATLLLIANRFTASRVPPDALATRPAALIDQQLRSAVERRDIPGVVAIAADRRRILYQGAFGMADVSHARPMTTNAIFRIYSMTKPITSVAALQLVERGRIGLEDPVEKYFPEFAKLSVIDSFDGATGTYHVRPATQSMTVRHLLTHTSGFGYNFTSSVLRDFKPRAGEQFSVGPLLFEPGERWLYGTSTEWVGRLVETVSGQTLDEYFRERILEPLGMRDTFFNIPLNKQGRVATGYRRQIDGTLVEIPNQPSVTNRFSGGGGLSSTAGDYVRFMRMLLNDGELDGARILARETVALMRTNQIGALGVQALKTSMPDLSNDFTFIANGRDKWGLGFLITAEGASGKRSAGSLSWGGLGNTYFWIDRDRGVAGVIMMQLLPFADLKALTVYDAFERGVYQLADVRQ